MKAYITTILLGIFMLAGLPAFAQDGDLHDEYGNEYGRVIQPKDYSSHSFFSDDDDPGSGEEGGGSVEDLEAPIDGIVLWLALTGIAIGWYMYTHKSVKPGK